MQDYTYDVFLSFTGGDRAIKDEIREHFEKAGLRCYDSDLYCKGEFRADFCEALDHSRVYLMILTDSLRKIPNEYGSGTLTEVRRECSLACKLEAHNQLNIVILCLSPFFRYDEPFHDVNDQIGWFFYQHIQGFSQTYGTLEADGTLSTRAIGELLSRCTSFIEKRNQGTPAISQAVRLEIASERLLDRGVFKGRENEVGEALAAFGDGKQAVVLTGLGGIGKTTLATEIARRCEELSYFRCPQIVHIRELGGKEDGLHTVVSSVSYERHVYDSISVMGERDRYERKLSALTALPDTVLLVIDNYNTLSERDLDQLLSRLRCRLLITTRVPVKEKERVAVISIGSLSEREAYEMFSEISGQAIDPLSFSDLYTFVGGHTITLCIMAKMAAVHRMTPADLLSELDGLDGFDARVDFSHNEYADSDTVLGHLRKLFDLSGFGEESLRILRSMSILGSGSIPLCDLMQILGLNNRNAVLELVNNGWLELKTRESEGESTELLCLHPILSRLSTRLLSPNEENVKEMIGYLLSISQSSKGSMTYTDAVLLADSLYYACYVLAGGTHRLARALWDRFTDVNHLLGDVDGTEQKTRALSLCLEDESERSVIASYADMITLEQYPTRVDILDKYMATLKTNGHDYKWVMRQLSVTFEHIVGLKQYREFLTVALERAIEAAISHRDDAALTDLFAYSFHAASGFERIIRRIKRYLRLRKKEGSGSASLVMLDLFCTMISAFSIRDYGEMLDYLNRVVAIVSEEKALPLLKLMLGHPIFTLRARKIYDRMVRLDGENDPYALPLQLVVGSVDRLETDGQLDADKLIEAALRLHELRVEQQTTLASAANAVGGALQMLSTLPEAVVSRATERITERIDPERISLRDLSNLQVAMSVNRQCQNAKAIEQSRQMVLLLSRIRPEGHTDILTALLSYADICANFGETKEALKTYLVVFRQMRKTAPCSSILIDLADKLLGLPEIARRSLEDLRGLKDTALSDTEENESEFYSVHRLYIQRVLDKAERKEISYETALEELVPPLCRTEQELKMMPMLAQAELLRAIKGLWIQLINQGQHGVAAPLKELYRPFLVSRKKKLRLTAKIDERNLTAYLALRQGKKEAEALYEELLSLCVSNHILQDTASTAIHILIGRYASSGEKGLPFLGTKIRSKRNLARLEGCRDYFRSLCFSIEDQIEELEYVEEIVAVLLPRFLERASRELVRKNYELSPRAYLRLKDEESFYEVVLELLMLFLGKEENAERICVLAYEMLRQKKGM